MKNLAIKNIGNAYNKKGNFTVYVNKARNRNKHNDFNLTDAYLETIWTGYCALTKVSITLKKYGEKNKPNTASLDRIDSNRGYIMGNVQFVAYSINLAKNSFTDTEILEFINTVKSTESY
jgi:hypothetical protein